MKQPETFFRQARPDGTKRAECGFLNGLPHGPLKTWYSNGQQELEASYDNGNITRNCKVWSRGGRFIGTFPLFDINTCYYSRDKYGSIDHIAEERFGHYHGRCLSTFEGDDLNDEHFYIYGREVSKQGYIRACEFDDTLPKYEGDPDAPTLMDSIKQTELNEWKQAQLRPREEILDKASRSVGRDVEDTIADQSTRDARQWLEDRSPEVRTFHKRYFQDASRVILDEAYAAGCLKVYACDIEREDENQTCARSILVEIPKSGPERQRALEWVIIMINSNYGFPPDDYGQCFFMIGFD